MNEILFNREVHGPSLLALHLYFSVSVLSHGLSAISFHIKVHPQRMQPPWNNNNDKCVIILTFYFMENCTPLKLIISSQFIWGRRAFRLHGQSRGRFHMTTWVHGHYKLDVPVPFVFSGLPAPSKGWYETWVQGKSRSATLVGRVMVLPAEKKGQFTLCSFSRDLCH